VLFQFIFEEVICEKLGW